MIISVHQPNFIPWLGYFCKIAQSDVFVFLDDVQFSKNNYINRAQILINGKANWLTVPVVKAPLNTPISAIHIFDVEKSLNRIKAIIVQNYSKTPFFNSVYGKLEDVLQGNYIMLADFNKKLIIKIIENLGLSTKIVNSECANNIFQSATDRLIHLCKQNGCSVYLSGKGGFEYQDLEEFKKQNIQVRPYKFGINEYPQENSHGAFVNGLSIIDCLFNMGFEKTGELIHGKTII